MAYWLLIVSALLILYLLLKRGRHELRFPGPKGLPIFGCVFSLRSKPMHEVLYDWSMQYGGAFKFSVFGKQFLVVSHPDTLHEIFVTRGKQFGGRFRSYQAGLWTENYQAITTTSNLALNKIVRKSVSTCLKLYGNERMKIADTFDIAVEDLMESLREAENGTIDPMEAIYRATTLSVYLLVFGEMIDDKSNIFKAVREQNEAGSEAVGLSGSGLLLDIAPVLRHLPRFPPYVRLMDAVKKRENIWNSILEPALENCQHLEEMTIGKALIDLLGNQYGEGEDAGEVDKTTVIMTVLEVISAGTITTSTTFYALLNMLQCYPDIQEKIYEEVRREIGNERPVGLDDKERLPYTRAVTYETIRLTSIAPFAIPHRTLEDTQLSGIFVPRGTEVIPNLWACHHNPDLWPDPWTFKPERFLDEEGQFLPADHVNRKQMLGFGAGTRVCPGEQFALHRLLVFIANCVQQFHFPPQDGDNAGSCDPRNFKLGIVLEVPGYKIRVLPRDRKIASKYKVKAL